MREHLAILIIAMIVLSGCINTQKNTKPVVEELNEKTCTEAGGLWDPCGSPCRGNESGYCIEVCKEYCYCGGVAGFKCPEGYECTDYLPKDAPDAMGICKKIS